MTRPAPLPARSRVRAAVLVVAALLATLVPAPADALGNAIQPGVRVVTNGGQCTANFVFTDRTGARFIGMAAHCANATRSSRSTDGCVERSLPLGTPVEIQNASRPGTLAYSSWSTMRRVGERDPDACLHNDFALVRIHPADHHRVNPTVPGFGGPTGIGPAPSAMSPVYSYGNSRLRPGDSLDEKRGRSLGPVADGWATTVYTLTPGVPGDSGAGYLDAQGRAFGVLSSVTIAPLTGSNTVTNLTRALAYMQRHTAIRVHAPAGWRPFAP